MLITFKSKAAGDVLMYLEHAKPILDLLQKNNTKGIITAAEMGQAVATLEASIAESRRESAAEFNADDDEKTVKPIGFATRAFPFLEMLRTAHKANCDVAWGV